LKNSSLIILLIAFTYFSLHAQENEEDIDYCNPRVRGLPRPVGLSINYERVLDYRINTTSNVDGYPDGEGEINYNRRIKLKFRVPLVDKDKFKLTYGFTYAHEEFRFADVDELDYDLYKSLEDKSLKSLGSSFYFLFPRRNNTFFAIRMKINLNGDYYLKGVDLFDFLKVSAGPLWGFKKSDNLMYGFGFAYTYTFGDPSIAPLFAYYNTFNDKWGVEALLPLEAKLRYTINDGALMYLAAETRGASYTIKLAEPAFGSNKTVELRHSEIKISMYFKKEIYDFIWLSVNAGYRYNLNFNLAESNRNRNPTNFFQRDYLTESQLEDAFFFNIGLNLVPPRKWLDR